MSSTASFRLAHAAALIACGLASLTANAEIYRWVDENGVVNYSDQRPAGKASRRIPPDAPTVSVYSPDRKAAEGARQAEDPVLRRRVELLEEKLARERRRAAEHERSAAEAKARRRERCMADRRVDCDEEGAEVAPVYWIGRAAHRRPRQPLVTTPYRAPKRPAHAPPMPIEPAAHDGARGKDVLR